MYCLLFQNFADMTMEERKQFVARRCSEVNKWRDEDELNEVKVSVLYDKEHSIMTCNNFKVGSSSIVEVFKSLSQHITQDIKSFRFYNLSQGLSPESINNSSAKTVMFVREPLQRLLSAYGNGAIVQRDNNTGKKVPFVTFLEDVLKVDDHQVNHHALSYFYRCRPCDIDYDYIGTMETFDEDIKYILQQSHIDIGIVPHRNNHKPHDSDDILKNVPIDIKVKIWERYKEDYFIFGYPYPI